MSVVTAKAGPTAKTAARQNADETLDMNPPVVGRRCGRPVDPTAIGTHRQRDRPLYARSGDSLP